jgi:dihydrofolate reductase / thymidylate synthase
MLEVIIATNDKNGIGKNNTIPWYCPDDLKLFSQKTQNNIIIVGRKTAESLPKLHNRIVLCVSSQSTILDLNDAVLFNTVDKAITYARKVYPEKKIFIAGGAQIYETLFLHFNQYISKIHFSRIRDNSDCDTYFDINNYIDQKTWTTDNVITSGNLTHYVLEKEKISDEGYIELLKDVYKNGEKRQTRNGGTKSLFFRQLSFDLRNGFPLLTTKKMFFRGIAEELIFFLRGETDFKKARI